MCSKNQSCTKIINGIPINRLIKHIKLLLAWRCRNVRFVSHSVLFVLKTNISFCYFRTSKTKYMYYWRLFQKYIHEMVIGAMLLRAGNRSYQSDKTTHRGLHLIYFLSLSLDFDREVHKRLFLHLSQIDIFTHHSRRSHLFLVSRNSFTVAKSCFQD